MNSRALTLRPLPGTFDFDLTSVISECQVWARPLPEPLCDFGQRAVSVWASDSLWSGTRMPPGPPSSPSRRGQAPFSPRLPRPAANQVIMSSVSAGRGFLKIACQAPRDARKRYHEVGVCAWAWGGPARELRSGGAGGALFCQAPPPWSHTCAPSVCVCAVAQPRLTLCNPTDCAPPGSSVHGILWA